MASVHALIFLLIATLTSNFWQKIRHECTNLPAYMQHAGFMQILVVYETKKEPLKKNMFNALGGNPCNGI